MFDLEFKFYQKKLSKNLIRRFLIPKTAGLSSMENSDTKAMPQETAIVLVMQLFS